VLSDLKEKKKVVGTRRLLKAIERGEVQKAFLALDSDLFIADQITSACARANVPIEEVRTKQALGEACSVNVPTAAAGILRD
jgi:large subunit ribosomal protein L7A